MGDYGYTKEYFDIQEVRAVDIRMLKTDAKTIIIFEMSEESVLTTVQPAYSILGVVEGLGGFAVVIYFIAKFLVNGFTDRLFLTELLEKFY